MEVGSVVNEQYTVVEHIGRGGMADVWSARDQRLRRLVAIKTIAVGLTQDIDPVALFRQEAQTIASMEHPHILPIYDFGEYGGNLYIVMRFVTGGSLEDLLQSNPMPPSEVLRIGGAIAEALDYAHANKIIHLDLKPPNILMDSGGSPYLADFGLATVLDPEGRARNPGSGTLLYMAPEQLTAEVIDHRADIYSFSIMIYHMMTGKLPFDGVMPLALRQLQFNDELPSLHEFVQGLPYGVDDILRAGTAKEPQQRPATLGAVITALRALLQPATARTGEYGLVLDEDEQNILSAVDLQTKRLINLGNPDLIEAVDIYTRARYNWAGGQGRFLVSLTHFLIMSNYYIDAAQYDLPVDEFGRQMLLRGALEYDVEVEYWWASNDDDHRRWVSLHTVRTGSTSARIRALYRLETLPDDPNNIVIPKLVAQALEVEQDTEARIAALRVLSSRSKMLKSSSTYRLKTEYQGRLLTTMTRLGIEVAPPAVWTEAVYSPEIDLMIAEQALDTGTPRVAEFAARTVGRIRSLTAVRHLANEQREKRPGALQSLALVRDEAPSLPNVVSPQARAYAWMTNTLRRLTDQPLSLILRFTLALLGGWIAFGEHIYTTYFSTALFSPQRWGNAIAAGLTMGAFVAIVVVVTDELSTRLRGFWAWWLRVLVSSGLGIAMGVLTWAGFRWFYYGKIPSWDLMRFGGMGLALAFVFVSVVNWRRWRALWLPALLIYIPIVVSWPNECLQDYYCVTPDGALWLPFFNYFPLAALGLAIGLVVGWFIPRRGRDEALIPLPPLTKVALSVLLGVTWVTVVWASYIGVYAQNYMNYDQISLWFFGSLFFGLVLAYLMTRTQVIGFGAAALVASVLLGVFSTQAIFGQYDALGVDYSDPQYFVAPQKELGSGGDRDSLLTYTTAPQLLTLGIPTVFVIALGAYVQYTFGSIIAFIGAARLVHRGRDTWLSGTLIYVMAFASVISIFALFSIHVDIAYGLAWSLWGFLTFVAALATWRWAKWGAQLLILLSVLFIGGALLFDAMGIQAAAMDGVTAPLLMPAAAALWGVWSVFVGVFAFGALRRQLWGAIGLLAAIAGWYMVIVIGVLPVFAGIQAVATLALVAFALQPVMSEMESGRLSSLRTTRQPAKRAALPVGKPQDVGVTERTRPTGGPAYAMMTEQDMIARMDTEARAAALPTEMDVRAEVMPNDRANTPAASLQTEMDVRTGMSSESNATRSTPTTTTLNTSQSKPRIKFGTATQPGSSDPTERERPAGLTEKPRLKLDMSALKKDTAVSVGTPPTEVTPTAPDQTSDLPGAPASTVKKPGGLKFDTSALKKNPPPTQRLNPADLEPKDEDAE